MTPLGSPRHTALFLLWNLFEAIVRSFGLIAGLVVLRGVLRSQRASVGIMFVLLGVSLLGDPTGALAFRIGYAAAAAWVALWLIFRFGLLALAAFAWIILDLWTLPVTFDPAAWYFGRSAVTLALIVGIAACAFVTALGGKPSFGWLAFED